MMRANFVRRGAGPPLVLLHGIGHRWQAWQPVLDELARHHDVLAVDLPGFGRSPVPAQGMPQDMPATVTAVVDFFAKLNLGRPHVAGNSLGGAICLELAAAGVVSSATAFAPAGFYTAAQRRRAIILLGLLRATTFQPAAVVRRALASSSVRALTFGALMTRPHLLTPERLFGDAVALRRAAGFRAVARSSRDYRFTGAPTVPVTIAWGTHDRILPPRQAERARELLPQARHVLLPHCGHVPMSDDPRLVARVVLQTTGALTAPP